MGNTKRNCIQTPLSLNSFHLHVSLNQLSSKCEQVRKDIRPIPIYAGNWPVWHCFGLYSFPVDVSCFLLPYGQCVLSWERLRAALTQCKGECSLWSGRGCTYMLIRNLGTRGPHISIGSSNLIFWLLITKVTWTIYGVYYSLSTCS